MGNGGEAEGERESHPDTALSKEPDTGLDLMILRSQPERRSRVGCSPSCATQVPQGAAELYEHRMGTKSAEGVTSTEGLGRSSGNS